MTDCTGAFALDAGLNLILLACDHLLIQAVAFAESRRAGLGMLRLGEAGRMAVHVRCRKHGAQEAHCMK